MWLPGMEMIPFFYEVSTSTSWWDSVHTLRDGELYTHVLTCVYQLPSPIKLPFVNVRIFLVKWNRSAKNSFWKDPILCKFRR